MRNLGKVIAHLPARGGSTRVPAKNLRYLGNQPLLAYGVRAALACKLLDTVYVNTDSDLIAKLAKELGASVYRRDTSLASNIATSDQFNMDIIEALKPDTLVMINPVCPLIEVEDIERCIESYRNDSIDTLITADAIQMQCFYRNRPVNIDINTQLTPTQGNEPVYICNWAITIWDAHKFRENYRRRGFAVFGENRKLFAIDPIKGIKISTEKDFRLAELLVKAFKRKRAVQQKIKHWSK